MMSRRDTRSCFTESGDVAMHGLLFGVRNGMESRHGKGLLPIVIV